GPARAQPCHAGRAGPGEHVGQVAGELREVQMRVGIEELGCAHGITRNRKRPMSCPESVTTSTDQRPTTVSGNAVLRENVRKPSRRPPCTGERFTTTITSPSRLHPLRTPSPPPPRPHP